jgi:hypothetical protein
MSRLIAHGLSDDPEVVRMLMHLSSLTAVLLVIGPWGDGCVTKDEVVTRWRAATAALVGEMAGYGDEDWE